MNELESAIWRLLSDRHCGAENAIKAQKIRYLMPAPIPGYRRVTKSCENLLEKELLPVISCDRGFYVAVDKEEIYDYYRRLELRNQGIYRRMAALKKVWPYVKPVDSDVFAFVMDKE